MSDLIDKEVLYNRFADLEAVALEQVKKYVPHENLTEWRIWSSILAERTAYKHDVFDAPVVDAEPVRHGHWKVVKSSNHPYGNDVACSVCGFKMGSSFGYGFCPNCGAKMDEDRRKDDGRDY